MNTTHITILLSLFFASCTFADEITSAKFTDETQEAIRIVIDGKAKEFKAPKGKFWDDLIVCKNRSAAFFVLHRGDPKKGSSIEDLHRYSADQKDEEPVAIPLKTELDEARIMDIFDASDDGSRLLIQLHYSYKKDGNSKFYRTFPYFFNTQDGKVTPVKL